MENPLKTTFEKTEKQNDYYYWFGSTEDKYYGIYVVC